MNQSLKFFISVCMICVAFGKSLAIESKNDLQVIFNQPQYAVGDTAYFALVELEKQFEKKSVVTIKLLDIDGNSHFYSRVLMTDGLASSYLLFPNQLPKGLLTLAIIPEVAIESKKFSYAINWLVSENGTIARMGKEEVNQSCKQAEMNIDSLFTIRSKVAIEVKGEKIENLVMAAYNKQLFADTDNGIFVTPDRVIQDSPVSYSQSPYFFRGRVVLQSGQPVRDSTGVTIYLRNSNLIYKVFAKRDGFFEFPLFMDFSDDWIFYKITYKNKPLEAKLELENLTISPQQSIIDSAYYKASYGSYNNIRKAVDNSYRFFKHGDIADMEVVYDSDIDSDIDVDMRKYEPFNTMYDVFLNVVPMVKYRIGEPDQLRVFLKKSAEYGSADPLYIVNGYMTDQTDYITGLDPRTIKRIEVLRTDKTLGRFGELGRNGIILIEVNSDVEIKSKNSLFIKGITKFQNEDDIFGLDSKSPDLRPSVFWWVGPKVSESEKFSFYTSNATGEYLIHAFFKVNDEVCSLKKTIQVLIK